MFGWMLIGCVCAIMAGFFMYWRNPVPHDKQTEINESLRVSLIIPARNEEKNLPILLKSAQIQRFSFYEVIVADDGSEDETANIARTYGAQVIPVKKEGDWTGKTAANWQGANHASGDLLIFMDADTWFANSEVVGKLVAAYKEQGNKGILSIQPYHHIQKFYENSSVIFNIITMAGMNAFSILGNKLSEAGVFGPFLLCQKEEYIQMGGQDVVQEALIEGFALGKIYKEKNLPIQLYSGKNLVHFRMYPEGISQLIEGWSKHFATGSQSTHLFIWFLIGSWIFGAFLAPSFVGLALFLGMPVWIFTSIVCYLLYFLQFSILARRTGNFSFGALFFYPLLFIFFLFVFIRSWIATHIFHTVTWKGRKIKL